MDLKRSFGEGTSSDKHDILDQLARKSLVPERIYCTGYDFPRNQEFEEAYGAVVVCARPYLKLTIKVQALNGETCTVEANRFDTAKDVKAKACEKLLLSTERHTLVYNGKELDDMSDLSSIDTFVECKFQLLPQTGLGLVDSVKSLFEYFRNRAHRLVEWFPDFFMDMSRALTEKDLSRISQEIGRGWQHLGAELGLSQAAIEQICEDNSKTSMKIFNMLRQWSIKDSVNATVNTLHNAMKNCRKVTFDMKAIERVFAGI